MSNISLKHIQLTKTPSRYARRAWTNSMCITYIYTKILSFRRAKGPVFLSVQQVRK